MIPWHFQDVQLLTVGGNLGVLTSCGLCNQEVTLDLQAVRPALRLALGLVTPGGSIQRIATDVAQGLDEEGGAQGFLTSLAGPMASLGNLTTFERSSLIISLDEVAEMEALEAEWREAEEMASIMDGELSDVPGFEVFKAKLSDTDE
jgi:hypothetical protein